MCTSKGCVRVRFHARLLETACRRTRAQEQHARAQGAEQVGPSILTASLSSARPIVMVIEQAVRRLISDLTATPLLRQRQAMPEAGVVGFCSPQRQLTPPCRSGSAAWLRASCSAAAALMCASASVRLAHGPRARWWPAGARRAAVGERGSSLPTAGAAAACHGRGPSDTRRR